LFLDRDGVINQDIGYLYRPQDFSFISGIFQLCRKATRSGYKIVIVTNQSGIARGYYTLEQFNYLATWMTHQFWSQGVKIDHINYCPHHPQVSGFWGRACCCRKPRPGMIIQSAQKFHLSLSQSVMVGDKLSDMVAARQAGISRRFLFQPESQVNARFHRPDKRFQRVFHLNEIETYL